MKGKKRVAKKITANQFRQMRDGNVAVLFFKEECPWCRQFKPEWNKVAKMMHQKSRDLRVPIVKLDVKNYPFVIQEVGFKTVPTTVLYKRGKQPYFYDGARDAETVWKAVDRYYRNDDDDDDMEEASLDTAAKPLYPLRERIRQQIAQAAAQVQEAQVSDYDSGKDRSILDQFLSWLGVVDDGDDF